MCLTHVASVMDELVLAGLPTVAADTEASADK